jgi:rRNA maturation endonuclease Nob1
MPTIDIPKELREEFGLILECTHPISMFDGVKIISRYLELQHKIDPETISETKLTEILEIFDRSKGLVTAEDLFQHMNNKFEENKEFYIDKLQTETKNLSEKLSENLISEDSKPFGQYGEITLNQIGLNLKENLKHLNDIR